MNDAIAVVGMACRFPGAVDLDAYWALLRSGRSGLRRFTDAELDARSVPSSLRRRPGYVPIGGVIDDQDHFDPVAFAYTEAEAALLDPQIRLFLQISRNALEHAGHSRGQRSGTVGVFAGSAHSAYLAHNLADRWDSTGGSRDPLGSLQTSIATQTDYLALHVAYRLNLTGPAVAVQSSCSTSLVAAHLASQSLLAGECDTALAGGVSLIVPQGHGYLYIPDGIFSRDGAVRAFGANSSGIVYSQGVGAVVLRRLEDARNDGDPIMAVIAGSAINNDGGSDKAGFTAPSVVGQATAIAEAHGVAGIEPSQVGLLEAHGTGTPIGDPVEVTALQRVFGAGPPWCALGSVKSNIGHANAAAGVASLIKAVLARAHAVLPPTLHAEQPNPLLKLDDSPFALVRTARAWDTPSMVGVSSFGIGGTNCHIVLGPAPAREPKSRRSSVPSIYRLSGASAKGVAATAERLSNWQAL
ncbi:MAG: polyketide synthase, partial [Myxococcota bacterium]